MRFNFRVIGVVGLLPLPVDGCCCCITEWAVVCSFVTIPLLDDGELPVVDPPLGWTNILTEYEFKELSVDKLEHSEEL